MSTCTGFGRAYNEDMTGSSPRGSSTRRGSLTRRGNITRRAGVSYRAFQRHSKSAFTKCMEDSLRGSITRRAGVSYRALQRHSKSAFTLAELLVVIGIIVLLISFSMPAIINAKRHAKQAKSNQQMRQLHAAILL